jgi:citrate/tricarballylate utilization protein
MTALNDLIAAARRQAVAGPLADASAEGARVMGICNSCRYCEGYCAVFPAMERRVEFSRADIDFLANLCHNCGACYYACQYAPPHDFAINVPRALAQVRLENYERFAWPRRLAGLYRRQGTAVVFALAFALALFFALAIALAGQRGLLAARTGAGSFYAVLPHGLMVAIFGASFLFSLAALAIGAVRYWRAVNVPGPNAAPASGAATAQAARDALTLRHLDGGGDGCYVRSGLDFAPNSLRRSLHHLLFYGFLLCFAATGVGTIYHYVFGWQAPYGRLSLPTLLGTAGGLGIIAGTAGLLWLRRIRDEVLTDPAQAPLDRGLLHLLLWTAATGLLLTLLHASPLMPALLALHLGFVLALFLLLPYGKFVHGVYRSLALLKHAREARTPNPVGFAEP